MKREVRQEETGSAFGSVMPQNMEVAEYLAIQAALFKRTVEA